ncbi:hypothetical protein ANN_18755 [Periplaneta americana]|uniref:Suppressor APC domain-containing protein n=1 Tax=Periplaneta americana TaxID=6978 RepID=A0ABQ8SQC7_PERAM|nr:hypothetical protein ANN_18755 [Periplaneta americana]
MAQPQSTTLDGLPKQFVVAMRTLFDIMDDKRTGYVKFSEIENRWQDDGTKGLPKGVIDSLQKVTPPNGLLSFERFCAGLKICLLRNQVESTRGQSHKPDCSSPTQPIRPPSAPLLDIESSQKQSWTAANTATVHPNNAMSQQRTLSMPQLLGERKENIQPELNELRNYASDAKLIMPNMKPGGILYGPPKPPRTAAGLERAMLVASGERNLGTERNLDKAEIRTALQNWQMGLMMNDHEINKPMAYQGLETRGNTRGGRGSGDGKPSGQPDQVGIPHKKMTGRRREPRRHTLQNGIDYNMLKRMKQIEQEKDVLMQGLQAVERAREWYLKQVAAVQEKMKYLGRMGSHMVARKNGYFTRLYGDKLKINEKMFDVEFCLENLNHTEKGTNVNEMKKRDMKEEIRNIIVKHTMGELFGKLEGGEVITQERIARDGMKESANHMNQEEGPATKIMQSAVTAADKDVKKRLRKKQETCTKIIMMAPGLLPLMRDLLKYSFAAAKLHYRKYSDKEQWTEAQQERLELQRARVLEVNRHLATLTDSWERGGLPLHMNLAVHHASPAPHDILSRLKQQNHLLTEEVSKKSERITALEREKASLIRELFQTRTQNRRANEPQDDTAFM